MWRRGVGIIFHRGIHAAVEGREHPSKVNTNAEQHVLDASRELQDLIVFEEWKAPTAEELRKFVDAKNVMNPAVDELLKDYDEFEISRLFRRREVFVKL